MGSTTGAIAASHARGTNMASRVVHKRPGPAPHTLCWVGWIGLTPVGTSELRVVRLHHCRWTSEPGLYRRHNTHKSHKYTHTGQDPAVALATDCYPPRSPHYNVNTLSDAQPSVRHQPCFTYCTRYATLVPCDARLRIGSQQAFVRNAPILGVAHTDYFQRREERQLSQRVVDVS